MSDQYPFRAARNLDSGNLYCEYFRTLAETREFIVTCGRGQETRIEEWVDGQWGPLKPEEPAQ